MWRNFTREGCALDTVPGRSASLLWLRKGKKRRQMLESQKCYQRQGEGVFFDSTSWGRIKRKEGVTNQLYANLSTERRGETSRKTGRIQQEQEATGMGQGQKEILVRIRTRRRIQLTLNQHRRKIVVSTKMLLEERKEDANNVTLKGIPSNYKSWLKWKRQYIDK